MSRSDPRSDAVFCFFFLFFSHATPTCLGKARLESAASTPHLFALDEIGTVFFGKNVERHTVNLGQ